MNDLITPIILKKGKSRTERTSHENSLLKQITAFMLLGYIVRLCYCIVYPIQPRDAFGYRNVLIRWEETSVIPFEIDYYPLSLLILRKLSKFFTDDIMLGGVAINIFIGLMIIALTITTVSKITKNSYVVLLCGTICCFHPTLIHFSCTYLRENTYLLFVVAFLFVLVEYYISPKADKVILLCLFSVLSFLCRLEGLELFLIGLVTIFGVFANKWTSKKCVLHILLYITSYVLIMLSAIWLLGFDSVSLERLFHNIEI